MKTLKKVVAIVLVVALSVSAGIFGTLAYLTDEEEAVNVAVVGNVYIDQIEQELDENGKLVDFTQAKPIIPAVYPGKNATDSIPYADAAEWPVANDPAWKSLDKEVGKNVLDKFVTVKNTGNTNAYVRTVIAFEGDPINGKDIHVVANGDNNTGVDWEFIEEIKIDGVRYDVIVFTYENVLKAGETTVPSLKQVYMDHTCGNEDAAKYGRTYDILVLSQAVQADGFANAKEALNEAFGEADATNVAKWFGETKVPAVAANADELVEALEAGEDVILADDVKINPAGMSNSYGTTGINVKNGQTIDGNGNTLDIKGAGGTWDSGINTTGGLIKDITVTGSFRGIFINHNSTHSETVVLENVTIDGTTYTISCDQGMNQNFEAYESTFNGWTSYAATLGTAKFVDCSFGEGSGNAYCRPYAPTEFVNCKFEAGYTLDPRAAVTFENCTLDGVALTDANIADLVTDVTKVTVK